MILSILKDNNKSNFVFFKFYNILKYIYICMIHYIILVSEDVYVFVIQVAKHLPYNMLDIQPSLNYIIILDHLLSFIFL